MKKQGGEGLRDGPTCDAHGTIADGYRRATTKSCAISNTARDNVTLSVAELPATALQLLVGVTLMQHTCCTTLAQDREDAVCIAAAEAGCCCCGWLLCAYMCRHNSAPTVSTAFQPRSPEQPAPVACQLVLLPPALHRLRQRHQQRARPAAGSSVRYAMK